MIPTYQKLIRITKVVMLIALPVLVVVLFSLWRSAASEQQQTQQNYTALNRAHRVTVDKLGRQTLEVQSIRATNKQAMALQVQKTDSLTRTLQQVIAKSKNRVTYAAVLQSTATGLIPGRPQTVDSLTTRTVFSDPYMAAIVTTTGDTAILEYRYTSELHVWHTYKNPLFGPAQYTTHIQDQNPNARITDAVTYEAPAPKPRRALFTALGVIGTVITIIAVK